MLKTGFIFFFVLLVSSTAQQTVFNVPNGDVLDKGKAYFELDLTFRPIDFAFGAAPRIMFGIGGRTEVGLNVVGITSPAPSNTTLSPTIKWKAYDGKQNGWAMLFGDNLFIPVQNRTYDAGNYFYAMFTRTWKKGTRIGAGAYHFSPGVVASGHKGGGQFTFEHPVHPRASVIADWYTGNHASGYVTTGALFKATRKLTIYAGYMVGNSGVRQGNHMFELEIGWNLN